MSKIDKMPNVPADALGDNNASAKPKHNINLIVGILLNVDLDQSIHKQHYNNPFTIRHGKSFSWNAVFYFIRKKFHKPWVLLEGFLLTNASLLLSFLSLLLSFTTCSSLVTYHAAAMAGLARHSLTAMLRVTLSFCLNYSNYKRIRVWLTTSFSSECNAQHHSASREYLRQMLRLMGSPRFCKIQYCNGAENPIQKSVEHQTGPW